MLSRTLGDFHDLRFAPCSGLARGDDVLDGAGRGPAATSTAIPAAAAIPAPAAAPQPPPATTATAVSATGAAIPAAASAAAGFPAGTTEDAGRPRYLCP